MYLNPLKFRQKFVFYFSYNFFLLGRPRKSKQLASDTFLQEMKQVRVLIILIKKIKSSNCFNLIKKINV